jgi:hypothetical protein
MEKRSKKTKLTPTSSPLLPRPRSIEFLTKECLVPKLRSPDNAKRSNEDLIPMRPAKRSTPKATDSSLLYKAENGKFTPHRIPSMENLCRSK